VKKLERYKDEPQTVLQRIRVQQANALDVDFAADGGANAAG
jgi:hypothetical protein